MTVFETEKISQRKSAVIAGIAMFIMAGCAAFTVGLVNGSLIVRGNADATAINIFNSLALFRSGIFGWLVILICDIVVSWALYSFLKQVDNSMALLGAWFRLIYCAILGAAIMNLVYVLLIVSGDGTPAAQPVQMNAQVMLFVDAFSKMWSFGLIIFGLHLLHVFFPQVEHMTVILENILSLPMALGELVFGIWLLIKGGRAAKTAAH